MSISIALLARASTVLLAVAWLPASGSAQAPPVERELRVRAGQTLDLDLDAGGSLQIVGGDADVVRVVAREGSRKCRPACRVDVEQTPGGVRVHSYFTERSRSNSSSLQFEVQVPTRFNVRLHSTGGDVDIDNVSGEITGETMGGELELRRLGGSLDLKTMGGAVRLRDSEVSGKVHTMGGEVRLENVSGGVRGTTMGGKVVQVGSPATKASPGQGQVRMHTMGGDINLDRAPAGADLNTMGGDISLRSAGGPVRARTMGGRIELDAVDGGVHATTMGGDVRVSQVGDPAKGDRPVEISSMGGDIELVLPAGSSLDLDVEIAYTREHEGDYRIISDFPVQIAESADWERKGGSQRKFIRGTGSVAGGRNPVKIRTVNGNVRIHRAAGTGTR